MDFFKLLSNIVYSILIAFTFINEIFYITYVYEKHKSLTPEHNMSAM